jgi:DNA invertase Pin-like site-specific DNA recombinase
MAVIGYARVSTVGQSLDVQREELKKENVDKLYQEKTSGKNSSDRPQLLAMLDYAREGDVVVCCKIDRIARSTRDLLDIVEKLTQKGVAFKVLNINLDTTSPTGKLMLTMLGAIATFEREMMLERQADGIAKAKENGVYKGRKPTALAKSEQVLQLLAAGKTKQHVADKLNIGIASVYRIAKAHKAESTKEKHHES